MAPVSLTLGPSPPQPQLIGWEGLIHTVVDRDKERIAEIGFVAVGDRPGWVEKAIADQYQLIHVVKLGDLTPLFGELYRVKRIDKDPQRVDLSRLHDKKLNEEYRPESTSYILPVRTTTRLHGTTVYCEVIDEVDGEFVAQIYYNPRFIVEEGAGRVSPDWPDVQSVSVGQFLAVPDKNNIKRLHKIGRIVPASPRDGITGWLELVP